MKKWMFLLFIPIVVAIVGAGWYVVANATPGDTLVLADYFEESFDGYNNLGKVRMVRKDDMLFDEVDAIRLAQKESLITNKAVENDEYLQFMYERLTIMRAKTELREEATVEDSRCAIQLYCNALRTIGLTPETAGAKENVLGDVEIQAVNDIEKMITTKMKTYGITNINNLILSDIKQEAGLLSHSLNLTISGDELTKIALGNVRKQTK